MAYIKKRGELQWFVRVRRKGFKPVSKTFETKVAAEDWGRETEQKMRAGTFIDTSSGDAMTLAQACDRYEKEFTKNKRGAKQEKSKLKVLRNSELASLPMSKVKLAHITTYRDNRLKVVGAWTVIKEMNLLSSIFGMARTEWHLEGVGEPVKGVKRPPQPKGRDRILQDPEELEWIIRATKSTTLAAVLPLAVESVMRRSEMVLAPRANVDIEKKLLQLDLTKNGEGRQVPLNAKARAVIEAQPKRDDGRLFGVLPNSVTQAFIRAVRRARELYERDCAEKGIEPKSGYLQNLRLHDMRHEGTTRVVRKFKNPLEAMAITGHKDYRSIKGYYHPDATDLADRMDD